MSQPSAERLPYRTRFEIWMRTGIMIEPDIGEDQDPPVETKFNPYHDPENGRFTFAPGGPQSLENVVESWGKHSRTPTPPTTKPQSISGRHVETQIAPVKPIDDVPTERHSDGSITTKIPPHVFEDKVVTGEVNRRVPKSGVGFTTYRSEKRHQFATQGTVERIERIGEEWEAVSDVPFQVGDISREGGGIAKGHSSHQRGTDVDIRPFRNDGTMGPTNWRDPSYDSETTLKFIKKVRDLYPKSVILFNDPKSIEQNLSRYWDGHDNHLHIKFVDER